MRASLDKARSATESHPMLLEMYDTLGKMLEEQGDRAASSDGARQAAA